MWCWCNRTVEEVFFYIEMKTKKTRARALVPPYRIYHTISISLRYRFVFFLLCSDLWCICHTFKVQIASNWKWHHPWNDFLFFSFRSLRRFFLSFFLFYHMCIDVLFIFENVSRENSLKTKTIRYINLFVPQIEHQFIK